jgi:hypothetical protein
MVARDYNPCYLGGGDLEGDDGGGLWFKGSLSKKLVRPHLNK